MGQLLPRALRWLWGHGGDGSGGGLRTEACGVPRVHSAVLAVSQHVAWPWSHFCLWLLRGRGDRIWSPPVQGRGMQVWVWGFGEMWVLYQLVWVTLCEAWGTAWGGLGYGTKQCGVQGWEV